MRRTRPEREGLAFGFLDQAARAADDGRLRRRRGCPLAGPARLGKEAVQNLQHEGSRAQRGGRAIAAQLPEQVADAVPAARRQAVDGGVALPLRSGR